MPTWGTRKPRSGDSGAIALLTAILLVGAVLPITALGASAYVRTSTAAELQRATDAGALAGAAEIPLVNLPFLAGYVAGQSSSPGAGYSSSADPAPVPPSLNNGPLPDACTVALADAESSHGLGAAWALPNGGVTCTAQYGPAGPLIAGLQSCASELSAIPGLPGLLATFAGTVAPFSVYSPLVQSLLAALANPTDTILSGLGPLLPALFQPTVRATLGWQVRSPFDGLMPGGGPHPQTVSSLAHEVAKNLVVLPDLTYAAYVENNSGAGLPASVASLFTSPGVDVNPTLVQGRELIDQSLRALGSAAGVFAAAPACSGVVTDAQGTLDQLVDPPNTAQDTISTSLDLANQQIASGQAVNIVGLSALLNIPFLDFTQVQCATGTQFSSITQLTQTVQSLVGGLIPSLDCTLGFTGAFRSTLVRAS